MPASISSRRSPISTQGAAPMRAALDDVDIAALGAEIGVHDQEPVHALRLRAEELHALPFGKRRQRRMRRAADEIDRAVAQGRIGLVDREDQLEVDVEPFCRKKPEFDGRDGRENRNWRSDRGRRVSTFTLIRSRFTLPQKICWSDPRETLGRWRNIE